MPKKTKTIQPIHPGETLREDFLKPLGLTANRLAIELRVPVTRVSDDASVLDESSSELRA